MRINLLNLMKIAPIVQCILCTLVQKMSTPEKVGDKSEGVPSTSKSNEEMSPCPPTDLRPLV